MKKSRTTRLIVLTLFIAVITAIIIAGTFAKYTSSENGTATVQIAKWSFKADGFGTERTDEISEEYIAEDLIAPGTSGTMGVELDLAGCEVAVDYKIVIGNVDNKPTNLVFKDEEGNIITATSNYKMIVPDEAVGGGATKEIITDAYIFEGTLSLSEIQALEVTDGGVTKALKTVGITWEWPYEIEGTESEIAAADLLDTQEATPDAGDDHKKMTFNVSVVGTQHNPEVALTTAPVVPTTTPSPVAP